MTLNGVGFKSSDNSVSNDKLKNMLFAERKKGNFSSYQQFKQFWDDKGKIWINMNKEFGWNVKSVVEELVRLRDPFNRSK